MESADFWSEEIQSVNETDCPEETETFPHFQQVKLQRQRSRSEESKQTNASVPRHTSDSGDEFDRFRHRGSLYALPKNTVQYPATARQPRPVRIQNADPIQHFTASEERNKRALPAQRSLMPDQDAMFARRYADNAMAKRRNVFWENNNGLFARQPSTSEGPAERRTPHRNRETGNKRSALEVPVVKQSTLDTRKRRMVQAAIDFGTTFSGYAFSFNFEFDTSPLTIHANEWQNVGQSQMNAKMPTCLLLRPDKTLHSFGYEAREAYTELAADGDHRNYYFLWNFKMSLHGKEEVKDDLILIDETGKDIDALTVFSCSLTYFRDHLMKTLSNSTPGIQDDDVGWVVTVPAIWNESAKKFMRLAAEKAGIPKACLEIALEPEAAALYCRQLQLVANKSETGTKTFDTGTRYILADCGGGTVDITVHEVVEGGDLKELHRAIGDQYGGNKVNENFVKFLTNVVGKDAFENFANELKGDYLELMEDFETKKRKYDPKNQQKMSIKISSALSELLKSSTTDAYEISGDKLRIPGSVFASFFTKVTGYIVENIREMLNSVPENIEYLLMVGGFSDSPVLQKAIKDQFDNELKVSFPLDASLCVLKGAVLYGHRPEAITERKSRYTFGLATVVAFEKEKHPRSKAVFVDKKVLCNDVFDIHVRRGDTVRYGEYQSESVYYPMSRNDTVYPVVLYRSTRTNPKFVDEKGCQAVGYYLAKRPFPKGHSIKGEEIRVKLAFGHSDVRAVVTSKDGSTETLPEFKF